jgi:proteasome alpha subunit
MPLHEGLQLAVAALGSVGGSDGAPRVLPANQLEVAVLDRTRGKRKFRRITGNALRSLLPSTAQATDVAPAPTDTPPHGEPPA